MAEPALLLTDRHQRQLELLLESQQQQRHWHGQLPVVLLDRCWLRLQVLPVEQLCSVLPPDSSGDAPELVRFRELLREGMSSLEAQEQCWQDFGREPCSEALRRFWAAQERGNRGWTLQVYLDWLQRYRLGIEGEGPKPLPLVVLARPDGREPHQLVWHWPVSQPMRHTCP
ncbi:MAG: hypothetical protein FJ053_00510 [Cyanobacteria bacterium M_surface_10_m1_298]|nr:hypothetical protein [Cyanobacteria bacterium M_surface_10_m1_298]